MPLLPSSRYRSAVAGCFQTLVYVYQTTRRHIMLKVWRRCVREHGNVRELLLWIAVCKHGDAWWCQPERGAVTPGQSASKRFVVTSIQN
jgi:hypothetical protein